jgi:hypothetical protein
MGRPPLPIGTHGRIDFHNAGSGRIRARARIRDIDGVLRPVTRWGSTEGEAQALLGAALRRRACCGDREVTGETRLAAAVQTWLVEIDQSDLAVSTRQLYRAASRLYLTPTLGPMRLAELSVSIIEAVLMTIRTNRGPQSARAARRALSSLCHCAVRHSALPSNPVRDTRPIACPRKLGRKRNRAGFLMTGAVYNVLRIAALDTQTV